MVRPVELQDLFAKTQAAERITQLQKTHLENQQRQAAADTARKAQADQRKPVPLPKTDEVILHHDQEKRDRGKKKKKPDDAARDDEKKDATKNDHSVKADLQKSRGGDGTEAGEPPSLDLTA